MRRGVLLAGALIGVGLGVMRWEGIPLRAMRTTPPAGIEATARAIGDVAPAISLAAAGGATWRSEGVFGRVPVVLVFYRGHW